MLVEQNSTRCYGIHPWKRVLRILFSFRNRHVERLASELIIGSRSREQQSILDHWNVPSNACNFIPVGTSVKRTRYYLPEGTQCFINNVALTPNRDANDAWCMHTAHVDSPSVKLTLSTAGNQCPLTRKRSSKTKPFVCPWTKGAPIGRRQREKRWRMRRNEASLYFGADDDPGFPVFYSLSAKGKTRITRTDWWWFISTSLVCVYLLCTLIKTRIKLERCASPMNVKMIFT